MRKFCLLVHVLVFTFMASCSPLGVPLYPNEPKHNTDKILKVQYIGLEPILPSQVDLAGTLILVGSRGDPSYRLDLGQNSKQEIPAGRCCFSTSPDRNFLAYFLIDENPDTEDWVVIEGSNGKEINKLPISKDWLVSYPTWLDNTHLLFSARNDSAVSMSVVIVNPFNGKQQEIASDYRDMKSSDQDSGISSLDFVIYPAVYHPSLDLVVYPKRHGTDCFVVLWDRQVQRTVAELEDFGCFNHIPVWRPDGELLAVALIPKREIPYKATSISTQEWFSISRDGDKQLLTNFGDTFDSVTISSNASWSPDGQRLAFWLSTNPPLCSEGAYLAVLELNAQEVTYYCINGTSGSYSESLIWSPDSQYLVVESLTENRPVILVDVLHDWATQIGENLDPQGWLSGEP